MIRRTVRTLVLPLLVGLAATAGAQSLADYDFVQDEVEFQTIVGAEGVHTDVWGYNEQDDGLRELAMPFAFAFGEEMIDSGSAVRLSANGYLQFGTLSMGASVGNLYTLSSHSYRAIAPYINSDGYCYGNIYWLGTTADDGRGVLVAEFRGITTWGAHTDTAHGMNYQIRLYDNGTIEVVYDESNFDAIANHTLIMAATGADRLCLTGTWAEAVPGTPASLPSLYGVPAAGTRYTFSRPASYCGRPQGLVAGNATASSLEVSWLPVDGAVGYVMYWSDNDSVWTGSAEVSGTDTVVEGLEAAWLYHFAVCAACADSAYGQYVFADGLTECAALTADRMPYVEDFESGYSNADFVPCWVRWYKSYSGALSEGYDTWSPNIIFSTSGSNTWMRLQVTPQANTGVDRQWCLVALPEFEADIRQLQLSFAYSLNQSSQGAIEIGVMTDRADTGSFEPLDTVWPTTAWDTATFDFASYEGEGQYIALRCYTTQASGYITYYFSIDDVAVLYTPTCEQPQSVSVDSVGTDFAALTIADDMPGTYQVTLVGDGDTSTLVFTTPDVELQGLQAATRYAVTVSKLCPDGTQTLSVGTQFVTACHVVGHDELPIVEDFNAFEAYNGAPIDACWSVLNLHPTSGGYPSSWQNHSGLNGNCLYLYADSARRGQYVSMPEVDYVNDLRLTFWTYCTQDHQRIDVGVMDDPTDTATFTLVATVVPQAVGTWDAAWEEHSVSLASYGGEGRFVALRNWNNTSYTGYAIAVDDVVLGIDEGCPHPVGIALAGATESSLTVSIDDTAAVGQYRLWVAHDSVVDSIDVDTAVVTIDDLLGGTLYTVRCAAVCPSGFVTDAVEARAWTLCPQRTADELPFGEGFEQWATGVHSELGACWRAWYGTADSLMDTYAKVYAYADYGNGGRHGVRMAAQHSYSTGEQMSTLVLPVFDVNPRLLQLDVSLRFGYQYVHEGEYVEAGILADPDDPQSFTACAIIENPGNYEYHDYSVRFGRFEGEAGAVALRYHYNVPNDDSYIVVDTVSLTLLDSEDVPCDISGLALADTTDSTATIVWEYGCEVDSFEVRLTGEEVERTLFTAQTQVVIDGLQPATAYSVRVRHVGQFWSSDLYFTTADTANTIPADTTATDTTSTDTTTTAVRMVDAMGEVQLVPSVTAAGRTVSVVAMPAGAAVSVIDAMGRCVLRTDEPRIATQELPAGVYFVRVETGGAAVVRRLVLR